LNISDQSTIARTEQTMHAELDNGDSVVMMNIESGSYYDVNRVGGRIWTMLAEPTTLAAICQGLRTTFDVSADTCRSQTIAFLSELQQRGLIRVS
jgi:hypothetical protein